MTMIPLASQAATASMVSMIPVVVTGGILLKFTEAILPTRERVLKSKPRRKQSVYSRKYAGNFSNVGL